MSISWGYLSLCACLDFDTKEIREALHARLSEQNPEIRGEALIGLAYRRDRRAIDPIIFELSAEFQGNWAIEAAEIFENPIFLPILLSLRQRILNIEADRFVRDIDNAISACKTK